LRSEAWVVCALLGVGWAVGCERQSTTTSVVERYGSLDEEIVFFEELKESALVSNNDALHALFFLDDGEDHWGGYADRVAEAKRRKWLPGGFDEPSTESADVGWIATAACRIAKVDGGVSMRVWGPIPRYAVRELRNEQILVGKQQGMSFTGAEFVDFLTRLSRNARLTGASALATASAAGDAKASAPKRVLPPTGRFE
jgi:hypothetical protein